MKHGYFIPSHNKFYGDMEFATESRELWQVLGLSDKFAGRYDGVSIHQLDNGTVVKRACVQDFFSEKLRVIVKDYPFT